MIADSFKEIKIQDAWLFLTETNLCNFLKYVSHQIHKY